jgi:nitrogen regulatory protein P-II 1
MLDDLNHTLRDANVGGMSHYRIEGRGKIKAEEVQMARGTSKYIPEYIPRTKVEVVVKDEQVEEIISKIVNRFGNTSLGGKIFVVDVPIAIDLVTNKRGESAL